MVESAESFGKYTLLERIAVGGMAEIYRAKTEGLGGFEKLLAIKRLHPNFGREHDVTQMLVDEARIAVHLTHANIAQIFDLGQIDSQYFIAMEYIDGVDLHQVNKKMLEAGGKVPVPALVFVVAEACAGLHYAHTRTDSDGRPLQIVHRDVSPQNIMISIEGEVKLVDFGIAKAELRAQQETQHGIIKGKFYYMAPEQAHGHHVDARTDVFAAGMVLYEILAGKNPYADLEEYELLKAVRKVDIPKVSAVRSGVDPALERIVTKATQRDPTYRFESARELQVALMEYLDQHHGPYRRLELAKFVGSVAEDPESVAADAQDSQVMSRVEYAASESSVIFDPGTPITRERDAIPSSENPFSDDEPTELWVPDAPTPAMDTDVARDELPELAPTRPSQGVRGAQEQPQQDGGDSSDDFADRPKTVRKSIEDPPLAGKLLDSIERSHLIAAAVVLVVLVGGGIALLTIGDGEDAPAEGSDASVMNFAASEASGAADRRDVAVQTTPTNAQVYLDGELRGTTPLTLEALPAGKSHTLQISKNGYQTLEETIQPSTETNVLEFELVEGGGVLKVTTYPPNAQVSVDGKPAGRAPVVVPGVSRTDSHRIVATLEDGQETAQTVSWQSGDERVKQVELSFDDSASADKAKESGRQKAEPAPRRRTRRRRSPPKRRRRAKPREKESAELNVWGDDSSEDKGDDGDLDIWGAGDDDQEGEKGKLSVRIRGTGLVYLNGKRVSDSTTALERSLKPGVYRVKVYFSQVKRYSPVKRVRVEGGQTAHTFFAP